MMRPRLDKNDLILVLEGLSLLFTYHARKQDREKATQIYLLFQGLSQNKIGRRQRWVFDSVELVHKRRIYYREMQKAILDIRESKSESETPSV